MNLLKWIKRRKGPPEHTFTTYTNNNFAATMILQVTMENFDGTERKIVPIKMNQDIVVSDGWRVIGVRIPNIEEIKAPTTQRAGSRRGGELRRDVAAIRQKLDFGINIIEDNESIAAVIGQALRKFNEMIMLFPDFNFRSTTDQVFMRMDGIEYEITVRMPGKPKNEALS